MASRIVLRPEVAGILARLLRDHDDRGDRVVRLAKTLKAAAASRERILREHGVDVPQMCFFSVTWRCDLECTGCYAKGQPLEDNLTTAEIATILEETTSAGTVLYAIAGGEPLQVPGLLETLEHQPNGIWMVFTNATLLDAQALDTVERAGTILPVISVEGEIPDTDARRGNGVGEAVGRAMASLRERGIPFAYSTMVTRENLDFVTSREYQEAMWEAGARIGFLVDYIPVAESLSPQLVLDACDRERKRALVAARFAEARPVVFNFPEGEYRGGGCMSAGNGFVHISANGDLEPCTFSHHATHSLRTSSYLEALSSPFFAELRRRFSTRPNPTGSCMLVQHEEEVAALHRECLRSASSVLAHRTR